MNIDEDSILKDFYSTRNITPNTKNNYHFCISKFCNTIHKTPSELLEEAEEDEDNGLRPRKRRIRKYFLQFMKATSQEGLSPRYIRTIVSVMKIFFNEYDIETPRISYKLKEESKSSFEDIPTMDDIKLALEKANLTYSAIILTMITSGMGRGEVLSLTYQDYLNAISEQLNLPKNTYIDAVEIKKLLEKNKGVIGKWHIQRVKTRKWYDTFTTWECLHKIAEYLVTQPPPELESALFRSKDNYEKYVKPLGETGFLSYFYRLNQRCNFGQVGRQSKFKSHNLRKYFVNAMLRSGASKLAIDWMIGHELQSGSDLPYFLSNPEYLLMEYMKGIDQLTVERIEVRRVETKEYKELIEKNIALENELTQIKSAVNDMEKYEKIFSNPKFIKLLEEEEFKD